MCGHLYFSDVGIGCAQNDSLHCVVYLLCHQTFTQHVYSTYRTFITGKLSCNGGGKHKLMGSCCSVSHLIMNIWRSPGICAVLHWQMHSVWWEDCMCDYFLWPPRISNCTSSSEDLFRYTNVSLLPWRSHWCQCVATQPKPRQKLMGESQFF